MPPFHKDAKLMDPTILLPCGDCKNSYPADRFPKNRARPTGRGFYCKVCHSARTQAWKKANPEKAGRKPDTA